jgi:hypothetical protein
LHRNQTGSFDVKKSSQLDKDTVLNTKTTKRILIAATPASAKLLSNILEDDFELIFVESIEQASATLDESIALIACDTHFDDCRMFDLLRLSKANPDTRAVPFLCLRVVEGAIDQTLYQSVDIASNALGAAAFIDLFDLKQKSGAMQANTRLNKLVEQLASRTADF